MDWSHLSDLQENVEKMAASVAAKVNDSIFVDSPQTWPGVWGVKLGKVEFNVGRYNLRLVLLFVGVFNPTISS